MTGTLPLGLTQRPRCETRGPASLGKSSRDAPLETVLVIALLGMSKPTWASSTAHVRSSYPIAHDPKRAAA
jgi:hypothetical protein